MKRFPAVVVLAVSMLVGAAAPASAHQPVTLGTASASAGRSPILVDGTVSFAVYAKFSTGNQTRNIRFVLDEGDTLKAEYLILDKSPERGLKKAQLPRVAITSPSGRVIELPVRERTPFFEPFGGKNYFFLSRVNMPGEPGVYTVTMKSRVKSDIVVAIGAREVRGEVINVGNKAGTCPAQIATEAEISTPRAKQLVGMSERAASSCAIANGWGFRVGERDGEQFAVTMDYRPDRVTVAVKSNRVVSVTVG